MTDDVKAPTDPEDPHGSESEEGTGAQIVDIQPPSSRLRWGGSWTALKDHQLESSIDSRREEALQEDTFAAQEAQINRTDTASSTPPQNAASGFWAQLRLWLLPSPAEYQQETQARLLDLNQMIARHPGSPSNYVLRGELYLKVGRADLAHDDFQRSLEIAERQIEQSEWGVIAQTVRDRAHRGLEKAAQRLTVNPTSTSATRWRDDDQPEDSPQHEA